MCSHWASGERVLQTLGASSVAFSGFVQQSLTVLDQEKVC
jgi:hypothetical protein